MLTTFSEIEQHIAQGTNLIFFIPTSLMVIFINWKNKNIDKKTALVVSISGIIGAIIGAKISVNMNVSDLRRYFGYFLIIIALHELYSLIKTSFIPYVKKRKIRQRS